MSPRRMQALGAAISLLVRLPIVAFLAYQILQRVGATELMWFLFWVYVPADMLSEFLFRVAGYRPCD